MKEFRDNTEAEPSFRIAYSRERINTRAAILAEQLVALLFLTTLATGPFDRSHRGKGKRGRTVANRFESDCIIHSSSFLSQYMPFQRLRVPFEERDASRG